MSKVLASANSETVCIFNDPMYTEQFSSFSPDDKSGKVKLYNAINSPDERLADMINMPIKLRDVVICKVSLTEKVKSDNPVSKVALAEKVKSDKPASKEMDDDDNPFAANATKGRHGFRVILLADDGKSYTATSTGIYNSVCTLRSVFGTLHFDDPLTVIVKQISTKNGNTLSLSIAE